MNLYLISPIGEGTAVAAGRLWKIGNIVHFHETQKYKYKDTLTINNNSLKVDTKTTFVEAFAHFYDVFRQENNVVKITATTGARCRAVGFNYFEGSMNLQIHWKLQKLEQIH